MKFIRYYRSSFVLLLFCFISCKSGSKTPEHKWTGLTMGTTYQVKVTQSDLSLKMVDLYQHKIDSLLSEVNKQMSTYDPQSEISLFNKYIDTTAFEVSQQFVEVVTLALKIYNTSGGAFDVTVAPLVNLWGFGMSGRKTVVPPIEKIKNALVSVGSKHLSIVNKTQIKKTIPHLQIDLSAIAKGYGVDVVTRFLESMGHQDYLVEIGGEVKARGLNSRNDLWKIGIDRPAYANLPGENLERILALKDVAVATSGDYRNFFELEGKFYSHTIDPKTGKPVTHNLASATIVAKNCMLADALATAVVVMGRKNGLEWIEKRSDAEALLLERNQDGTFAEYQTSGFARYIDR